MNHEHRIHLIAFLTATLAPLLSGTITILMFPVQGFPQSINLPTLLISPYIASWAWVPISICSGISAYFFWRVSDHLATTLFGVQLLFTPIAAILLIYTTIPLGALVLLSIAALILIFLAFRAWTLLPMASFFLLVMAAWMTYLATITAMLL